MSDGPLDYQFQKTPIQKNIRIESAVNLDLEEILRFLDGQVKGDLSQDLLAAREDLRLQASDPSLKDTTISGRDPSVERFLLSQDERTQLSKLPRTQWLRFIRYRYRFKTYPRRRILSDFPIVMLVEPTSICNLRCQMCFQSDESFSSDRAFLGKMDFGLYQRIIDEMAAHDCDALVLASRGEPTLHPRFADMLAYATPRILDVKVNTNATRLDEALCHKILEAEPSVMVFSIDSADPAQYEEIRKGAHFDHVLENVRRFRDIRAKQYSQAKTTTRVSGTLFRPDQDGEALRSFWSEYVDQVALHTAWPFWDSYNAPLSDVTSPCGLLWERMYVWWDGVCNPCDIDYKSLLSPGKVDAQTSIQKIWRSEKTQQLRQRHESSQKNACVPCNRCSGTV